MELSVWTHDGVPPGVRPVEVVERKGLGHPDTICDGIAELVCVRLCRYYLDHFGMILHHNVDKVLLVGGAARPAFGGGEVVAPIEIYLAGRATQACGGLSVPVHEIAIEACHDWLRRHLRALDVDRHVRVVSRLRPGSADLTKLFARGTASPPANDTSCGTGFAPATDLERVVLGVEQALNAAETKQAHPAIGEDIKVMGVRRAGRIALTIGCAAIDRHLRDLDDYARLTAVVRGLALAAAQATTALELEVCVNAADDLAAGEIFLTTTGTSAEAGDDGEVGRGNRVGGLITPGRPMTLEAAAGKNPVSHVGKLYNVLAGRIAASVAATVPGVADVTCTLVSRIGYPVDDPQVVDVAIAPGAVGPSEAIQQVVREVVAAELGRLDALRDELLAERLPLF